MGIFLSPPPDIRQPVVIQSDGGGLVEDYKWQAMQYRLEKRRVEIRGSCRSACILALSVPNVCVAPGAVVKAHHAYNVDTKEIRYDITESMLAQLPPAVRARLAGNITVDYNPKATLDYTQLRSLGIRDCDGATAIAASTRTAPEPSRTELVPAPKDTRPARVDITTPLLNIAKLPLLPIVAVAKAIDRAGRGGK
jgi:hypothetical protein